MHSRIKDQVVGTNEVAAKYGKYPAGWGDIRPSRKWLDQLFRAESADHDSPRGYGGEHLIVNVWKPLSTVHNWGLAVLDGRTLSQGDVHPTALQHTEDFSKSYPGGPKIVNVDGREVKSRV